MTSVCVCVGGGGEFYLCIVYLFRAVSLTPDQIQSVLANLCYEIIKIDWNEHSPPV